MREETGAQAFQKVKKHALLSKGKNAEQREYKPGKRNSKKRRRRSGDNQQNPGSVTL